MRVGHVFIFDPDFQFNKELIKDSPGSVGTWALREFSGHKKTT